MEQRLYKNGLPFSTDLANNIKNLIQRVENKKAALLIIDGGLGEGKTTLLIHILDYINSLSGKGQVVLDGEQLSLGGADFLKKIRICHENKMPCIGYDEAGDFGKRSSLTRFNAMINRTFETFRAFKCIVVIALPSFFILDNELLDKNVPRLMLHLKSRKNTYGNFCAYSLYRMQLLKARMYKNTIKNYAFVTVKPNFYGHFLNLDTERCAELDRISTKNKLAVLQQSEVKIAGLFTIVEVATKMERSPSWVRMALDNLKLKPSRIVSRFRYYDEQTISALAEHRSSCEDNDRRQDGNHRRKEYD